MVEKIKYLFRKMMYPHSYDSAALIKHINDCGGKIGIHSHIYASHKHHIDLANIRFVEIGDYCLITEGVVILAHDYSYAVLANVYHDLLRKQRVTKIGNNVFIGMNSIILMGTEIGDNVVIGAGSVVSGKVESNSVYCGNPARRICSLQEYHEKRKKDYLNSAMIYAAKTSMQDNMGVYRCLFEDKEKFYLYLNEHHLNGIDESIIQMFEYTGEKLKWDEIFHQ